MSEITIPHVASPNPFEIYTHIVEPLTDADGYLISFPDLPGCLADGDTEAEAVAHARDAFSAWMSALPTRANPSPNPPATANPPNPCA